jgi:hypothetical protein
MQSHESLSISVMPFTQSTGRLLKSFWRICENLVISSIHIRIISAFYSNGVQQRQTRSERHIRGFRNKYSLPLPVLLSAGGLNPGEREKLRLRMRRVCLPLQVTYSCI